MLAFRGPKNSKILSKFDTLVFIDSVAIVKLFCKAKQKQFSVCDLHKLHKSLEQFFLTGGQNNFGNNIPCLRRIFFFLSRCPCRSLRFLSSHFFTFISHCTFCGRWLDSRLIRLFYFLYVIKIFFSLK